jgi:hypothetical protein
MRSPSGKSVDLTQLYQDSPLQVLIILSEEQAMSTNGREEEAGGVYVAAKDMTEDETETADVGLGFAEVPAVGLDTKLG